MLTVGPFFPGRRVIFRIDAYLPPIVFCNRLEYHLICFQTVKMFGKGHFKCRKGGVPLGGEQFREESPGFFIFITNHRFVISWTPNAGFVGGALKSLSVTPNTTFGWFFLDFSTRPKKGLPTRPPRNFSTGRGGGEGGTDVANFSASIVLPASPSARLLLLRRARPPHTLHTRSTVAGGPHTYLRRHNNTCTPQSYTING